MSGAWALLRSAAPKPLNSSLRMISSAAPHAWSGSIRVVPRDCLARLGPADGEQTTLVRISRTHESPDAMNTSDFSFAFQPIADIETRTVFAYEALVRGPKGEPAGQVFSAVPAAELHAFDHSARIRAITLAGQ